MREMQNKRYLARNIRLWRESRERPKSGLFLRLKKRKVFKIVKGDPSSFLKLQFLAKYEKKLKGNHLETLKVFRQKIRDF